jgi:oligoendopeptidase F
MTTASPPAQDQPTFDWQEVHRRIDDLLAADLTPEQVPAWLGKWSDISKETGEAWANAYRGKDEDTTDQAAQERYLHFVREILPQAQAADQELKTKLLAVQDWQPGPQHEQMLKRLRAEADLYRDENVKLEAEIASRGNEYRQITGRMTVTLDGEELTFAQAGLRLQEPDRRKREEAWRAMAERRLVERDKLDRLYLDLLTMRRQVARNASLPDYRAYVWREKHRFDYSPDDCHAMHDAVEAEIVPLVRRLRERRREKLGLESLRPWDQSVDPLSRPPLRPFTSASDLEEKAQGIFNQLDPALGADYARMRGGHLSLESRKGKAPGARSYGFPKSEMSYVFMSAAGTHGDVTTLLHECGHAFHGFAAMRSQPLSFNHDTPMEFNEVASMAMELLGEPYLRADKGGFYSEADAKRALAAELESTLGMIPYMMLVDAFQHWVYTEAPEDVTAEQFDGKWVELFQRFMPGVDYSGLEVERAKFWHRQLHIFLMPFYYIEYAIAQLGAFQVWRNALSDQAGALAKYRAALSLGGTRPLPELYEAAGIKFAFDRETIGSLTRFVEEQLEKALD